MNIPWLCWLHMTSLKVCHYLCPGLLSPEGFNDCIGCIRYISCIGYKIAIIWEEISSSQHH